MYTKKIFNKTMHSKHEFLTADNNFDLKIAILIKKERNLLRQNVQKMH